MPNEPIHSPRMHHADDGSLSLNTFDNSILDNATLDTPMSPNGALPMFFPPHRSPPMSPGGSDWQSSRSRRSVSSPLRSRRPDFRPPKEPERYYRSGIVGDMMREKSPEESVSSSAQRRYRFRVGSRRGDFVDPPAAAASPRQRRSGEASHQQPDRSPPRREDGWHDLSSSSQSPSRSRAPTKRLDMRYDDDEFAYVAHMIMLHIQRQQELNIGCASLSEFFDLFNFFQAPTVRRIESQELNEDLLAEFRFALKHRLKQISLQIPKNRKENEVTKLTRQVSKIISLHGYPKLKRKPLLPKEDDEFIVLAIGGDEDNTTHTSETTISNISPVIVDEEEKEGIAGAADKEAAKDEKTKTPRSPTFPVPPAEAFKLPAFVSTPKREAPDAQVESPPKQHFFSEQNTSQQQPQDPYNQFQHDPDYSHASSAQYQAEANPYQSPSNHANPDYIRQQYQQHLQQQQQHHLQQYEEEPVFEIMGDVYAPVVDAYYEDPEPAPNFLDPADRELSQNLVMDSQHEIYVGIDRSFEEEAVVMRELDHIPPSCFPIIAPDGSITENLVVPASPPLSPNRSMLRLHLMDEAKRVTNMMNVTSNNEVRKSCQKRMTDIGSELERLNLHCEDSTHTSSNESQSRLMVDVMAEESSEEEKMSMREEGYSYRDVQARSPARNDRVVHVMAPSNLPQAYEFEAQLGNQNLTATVVSRVDF